MLFCIGTSSTSDASSFKEDSDSCTSGDTLSLDTPDLTRDLRLSLSTRSRAARSRRFVSSDSDTTDPGEETTSLRRRASSAGRAWSVGARVSSRLALQRQQLPPPLQGLSALDRASAAPAPSDASAAPALNGALAAPAPGDASVVAASVVAAASAAPVLGGISAALAPAPARAPGGKGSDVLGALSRRSSRHVVPGIESCDLSDTQQSIGKSGHR